MHSQKTKGKKMPKGQPALVLVISAGKPLPAAKKKETNAVKNRKKSKTSRG